MTSDNIDPARVARLRSEERLKYVDPAQLFDLLDVAGNAVIADVGAGVGFVTFPLARRFPEARILACDILDGMLALLREEAASQGLANIETITMAAGSIPLEDDSVDAVTMLQVHHELEDARSLLAECARVLRPGGGIYIVDWLNREGGPIPAGGRRVAPEVIADDLAAAGFTAAKSHSIYEFHSCISAVAPG